MHCGRLNRNIDYKFYVQTIHVTESEKDLGVIINNDMKFKNQVASAAKKANKTLGMIKRNFKCINKDMFEVLYSGTTIRICCASMVIISNLFKRKIRAVTKKSN